MRVIASQTLPRDSREAVFFPATGPSGSVCCDAFFHYVHGSCRDFVVRIAVDFSGVILSFV